MSLALGLVLSLVLSLAAFKAAAESGFIGLQIQAVDARVAKALGLKAIGGALVKDVAIGEAGAIAGFRRGDLITAFAGDKIRSFKDLIDAMAKTKPGQQVPLTVSRRGKPLTLLITINNRPAAWKFRSGAFHNFAQLGFTVVAITKKVRQRFKLRWGTIGLVVTLVNLHGKTAGGLKSGDVIVSANLRDVWHPAHLIAEIKAAKADGRSEIIILVENSTGYRYSFLPLK